MITQQIAGLRQCWNLNGGLSVEKRKHLLFQLAKSIRHHEALITSALKSDLGKGPFETYASEVGFILGDLNHTLRHLNKWSRIRKVGTPLMLWPARSFLVPEPLGVVLIIAPWNYPFQLCMSPLIGAIAAGNRVVLKPSELSSATSEAIKTVIKDVFTKEEVLLIEGGVSETEEILRQKFDHIFFTGSTQVGKVVMRAAAEFLTPVTLELGGKSPFLVEETANIDVAAKRCIWGKFMNAGQTCVAPDYALVPRKFEQEFLERLSFHLDAFYGEDVSQSHDYGRMISKRHHQRLLGLIPTEKIHVGGKSDEENRFLAPTILRNISWKDPVMKDEIFGPILPVIAYDKFEDALEMIQQRPKPLALYLFSESNKAIQQVLARTSFGGGCVNDTIVHLANHNLPFGGVGDSGIGSYHGKKSFDIFTHEKSVLRNSTRVDIPLRYPPYKNKLGLLRFFLG
jgi:aldehyde dehydrogenase (NAD+)